MITSIQQLIQNAKSGPTKKIAVVCAHDAEVLLSLNRAVTEKLVSPILVGKKSEINALMTKLGLTFETEIIDCATDEQCAEIAVKKVSSGEAHMLMKGLISTGGFLKAVLNKEWGLRRGGLLSHVTVFESEGYDRLFLLTDVAMNIAPNLAQKKMIIENAVDVAHKMGIKQPKVAQVCAVETVNPSMPCTVEAAELTKMCERGEIKDCLVGGPFGLDNAISIEAAQHKKIIHPVAGHADILMMPDIESGNVFYKALSFLCQTKMAAIITGARAPIVLTSRADTDETKYFSIALAAAIS